MDVMDIKRILGRYFFPQAENKGTDRRQLTPKQMMRRKSRNRMARESRRRNRK